MVSFGPIIALADENDLVVNFESTPLFSEANFLPGSTITRTVEVINNTLETKEIIAEAINVSDPDDFSGVLNLVISEGETELYNDTLEEFFNAGETALSSLVGSGGSTTYNFSVTFVEDSGNNYQEAELGFDIIIGFQGEGGIGGDGGGGGGGGGGGSPVGLSIIDETIRVLDVETTSVTIVWDTSYRSTSRGVFGTASGVFDFSSPPNYGYPFSTAELNTPASSDGVFSHSVIISGLTSGTTYYFRAISHASPATLSFEHSFSTLGFPTGNLNSEQSGQIAGLQIVNENISLGNSITVGSQIQDENQNSDFINDEKELIAGDSEEKTDKNNLSLIFSFLPFGGFTFWLILIIVLIVILIFYKRRKNKKIKTTSPQV